MRTKKRKHSYKNTKHRQHHLISVRRNNLKQVFTPYLSILQLEFRSEMVGT